MHISTLHERLAFAPQITPENVSELAELGFEQLICNRPDGEEVGQPSIANIQTEAEKHGLSLVFAPVANSQFTEATIDATQNALANGKKTLMFCRSGTRSSIVWAIIRTRQGEPLADTIAQLAAIGYDIAHLEDTIQGIANPNIANQDIANNS